METEKAKNEKNDFIYTCANNDEIADKEVFIEAIKQSRRIKKIVKRMWIKRGLNKVLSACHINFQLSLEFQQNQYIVEVNNSYMTSIRPTIDELRGQRKRINWDKVIDDVLLK